MRRSYLVRVWPLFLYCLVAYSLTANSQELAGNKAYFSLGLAAVFPEETRFTDGGRADSGIAKLYGNPDTFTDGDIDTGIQWRAGMGYRFTPSLRWHHRLRPGGLRSTFPRAR